MSISVRNTVKILVCAALALATTQLITRAIVGSTAAAAQAPGAAPSAPVQTSAPAPIPEIVVYGAGSTQARPAAGPVIQEIVVHAGAAASAARSG